MRLFISSVISGFGEFRDAAGMAIETLSHEVIRSEKFGVRADTPERACLAEVRASDAAVLLLGARYGVVPAGSEISPTHQEFREAIAASKPVLAFIQRGVEFEPNQEAFIREVREWRGGTFTGGFGSAEELRSEVTRAVHQWEMSETAGSLDPGEMTERASAVAAALRAHVNGAQFVLVLTPGPRQRVVENSAFADQQLPTRILALLSGAKVFDPFARTRVTREERRLLMVQETSCLVLDQFGTTALSMPAHRRAPGHFGIGRVVDEYALDTVAQLVRGGGTLLEDLDPVRRVPHTTVHLHLMGAAYTPWNTRAEFESAPNSATMSRASDDECVGLDSSIQRGTLLARADYFSKELTAELRDRVVNGS